ncbi:chymotrypsin-like elastase family member 2A [Nephila pilipes]|uniref:Chymotrypsin-like elastase family member 2A n=1 Tax=Nephila pilipes TaxID=299642 RepID=A0A8X6PKL2_NEPPI|nr:chymotrypsin-like elastase family member 2A [Nephila pilipes]
MTRRMMRSREMLQLFNKGQSWYMVNIVPGDDIWLCYYNVPTKARSKIRIWDDENTPETGDSGGPAVYDDPISGKPVAIGVASFISFVGCGRPLAPSVYTRIVSYIDWLTETVGEDNQICFI